MEGVPMKVFASESNLWAAASAPAPPASELPMWCSPSIGAPKRALSPLKPRGLCPPPGVFAHESSPVRQLPESPQFAIRPPPGLNADEGFRTPSVATRSDRSEGSDSEESLREWRTTLHVRNLPCYFTRDAFLELVDAQGLSGQYDFVYLPMDFKTKQSIGYAFVNFRSSTAALLFRAAMHGFKSWRIHSHKVCSVQWSQTQGFEKNIKLVRRSDVMKKSGVPDEFKPMVFVEGVRVPFPNPPEKARSGPRHLQFQPAMAGTILAQHY